MLHNMLRAAASSKVTVNFRSSATSTVVNTIPAPSDIVAGDIIVLYDTVTNVSGIPVSVVPAGFTYILDFTASNRRTLCSYKVATGSEAGTTITGMNGTETSGKIMMVFSTNGAVSAVAKNPQFQSTDLDPAAQTITSGSETAPLIAIGFVRNGTPGITTMTPTQDGIVTPGGANSGYYKVYNFNPANVTFDTGDGGNTNLLMSFYLEPSSIVATPPPVYVSSNTASKTASGTTLSITKPAGVAVGDLLVAVLVANATDGWDTLSGWTRLLNNITDPSTSYQFRIADGTEPATLSFTCGVTRASGIVMRFTGAASTYVGSATGSSSLVTPHIAPSVTITNNKSLVLSIYTSDTAATTWTGVRSNVISAFSTSCSFNISYDIIDVGATGTRTGTPNTSQSYVCFQAGISS